MGWVSMFANIAGMLSSVDAERKEQLAREEEAKENQKLAELAALDAERRASREVGLTRMAGTKLASRQRLAYAASGVDPGVGTAAATQAETAAMTELDAATLENNAAREAWGFRTHGLKFGRQAELDAMRSNQRIRATVLGGVGQMAASYARSTARKGEE